MTGEILYDSRYGQLTPEDAEKIRKSREEVKKLKSRTLRCPVCGFRLEEIYELTSGYVQVKCRKCKLEEPLNLAYFRRLKRNILLINPYVVRKAKKVYGYEDTRSKTK